MLQTKQTLTHTNTQNHLQQPKGFQCNENHLLGRDYVNVRAESVGECSRVCGDPEACQTASGERV